MTDSNDTYDCRFITYNPLLANLVQDREGITVATHGQSNAVPLPGIWWSVRKQIEKSVPEYSPVQESLPMRGL